MIKEPIKLVGYVPHIYLDFNSKIKKPDGWCENKGLLFRILTPPENVETVVPDGTIMVMERGEDTIFRERFQIPEKTKFTLVVGKKDSTLTIW